MNVSINVITFTCIVFSAVLNDQTMRMIARKAGSKRSDLGYELGLESADIVQILCKYSDPTDQAFYILLVKGLFILSHHICVVVVAFECISIIIILVRVL